MRSRIFRAGVAVLLVACLGAVSSGSAAAAPGTPAASGAAGAVAARSSGVNDWGCRPSSAHPNPVVLLHGLGAPSAGHWAFMAPYLATKGYCVFYFTYGKVSPLIPLGGFRPIADSAREIAGFVDDVRAATHSAEVDIVGHSEGGFLSLYIPKVLHLGGKIGKVVSLAPPAHGTDFASLVQVANLLGIRSTVDFILRTFGCDACSDLITGGPAVQTLNTGPVAEPGVAYTIIASRTDVLVTPTETSFVREPGVRNLYVQDLCPLDPVGHIGMAFDPGLATMISNALDPSSAVPVTCSIGLPF